jgi:AcrR family transcriptional regulator
MTDPTADLGPVIRAARTSRGLSLREVARQVGMSPSTLSEFETGKGRLSEERLGVLAAAFDVPLPPKQARRSESVLLHWRDYDELTLEPALAAALELFVERGYHGASVRMIAAACGMTVAGLYHHVPSKQELLLRLLRRAMAEMVARCAAADAEGVVPRQRLANLTESMVRFHVRRLDLSFLAANEIRGLDPDGRSEMLAERRRVDQLFLNAVADCRMIPGAAPDRPTARAIVTMCTSIPEWYADAGSPDLDELAAQYVGLALGMV